jgi:hypothetical protein
MTQPDEDGTSLRDSLRRLLNPLDVVLLSRERLQDALDDAVQRGRMTRDDASDLLTELMRRSRAQTEDVLRDLAAPALRAAGLGDSFPIAGYDDLTAAEIIGRLPELSPGALRQVRDYERRNANRKTVLAAVDAKLT